jgi:hypothetical protein
MAPVLYSGSKWTVIYTHLGNRKRWDFTSIVSVHGVVLADRDTLYVYFMLFGGLVRYLTKHSELQNLYIVEWDVGYYGLECAVRLRNKADVDCLKHKQKSNSQDNVSVAREQNLLINFEGSSGALLPALPIVPYVSDRHLPQRFFFKSFGCLSACVGLQIPITINMLTFVLIVI